MDLREGGKNKNTVLPQEASRIPYFIFQGWGKEISVSLWTLKMILVVTHRQLATTFVS